MILILFFLKSNLPLSVKKKISDCFGFALRRYVIGPENLHDPPNQVKIEN